MGVKTAPTSTYVQAAMWALLPTMAVPLCLAALPSFTGTLWPRFASVAMGWSSTKCQLTESASASQAT